MDAGTFTRDPGWLGPVFAEMVATGRLSVAITGAGSWLGQAFLALLENTNTIPEPARLRLFASASRVIRFAGRDRQIERLSDATPLSSGPWLLLHFAFLGKERTADLSPAAFVAANEAILQDTLRLAANACGLRVVFASSGAVYRPDRTLVANTGESPYGWCKVQHERQLTDWCAARAAPLVVPRIFNIGGPFVNKLESYALSSFIHSARRWGLIRIEARRPTFRSFVHVNELLAMLCAAALAQEVGPPLAFDTAGTEIVEMETLARAVASALAPASIKIERDPVYGEADRYVGDGETYRAMLSKQDRTIAPLRRIIQETAAFMNARLDAESAGDASMPI